MQFISFCLFTILCGYSLVIAAPIKNNTDSLETKQQKATVIAGRLLQEIANEQLASHPKDKISEESVQPIESTNNNDIESDDDEESIMVPSLENLYEIYESQYEPSDDDEELSLEENGDDEVDDDDDGITPITNAQLIDYLINQEDNDESVVPMTHSPVMDDTIMTAENHQREQQHRRRRSIY